MVRFAFVGCAVVGALMVLALPADAQSGRRTAAEAYAGIIDYGLLIEKAAIERAEALPWGEREAFVAFVTGRVDPEMTRFYAIGEMVELFDAAELDALAAFGATPEGRAALAKLPALGTSLGPLIQRQIDDAARNFKP
jgi:hypothetical protein